LPARALQEGFSGDFYPRAWLRWHSLLAFFALTFGIDGARPYLFSSLASLHPSPPYALAIGVTIILFLFFGSPTGIPRLRLSSSA